MSAVRVLLVEGEAKMANLLSRGLQEEGHAVDVAGRGEDAFSMAGAAAYDAIILDVTRPGLEAQTCAKLREQEVSTPVLILTDRDADDDQAASADTDAYLAKPFSFSELLARLDALKPRAPL